MRPSAEPADDLAGLFRAHHLELVRLAALPRRRREVLVLRYYVGLSEAEIATTLGISPGT
jgi:DNA-directed RNA polymerase specialized sigma24 family protein